MTNPEALDFIDERLRTMKYEGVGSKEAFDECIDFLKCAKRAIEKVESDGHK